MLGAVSSMNYNLFHASQTRGVQQPSGVWAARRAASPEAPVEPVRSAPAVKPEDGQPVRLGPAVREGADPAEMAVRMRITPYEEGADAPVGEGAEAPGLPAAIGGEEEEGFQRIPDYEKSEEGNAKEDGDEAVGAEGAQAAAEEGKCETCEKRKYQDGSDDAGVSFKTPTRIAPEQAASAVRGHEQEHVVRERAKAKREDRRVVSQSVTMHTAICPECGKVYVSGGTTRTVTAASNTDQEQQAREMADRVKRGFSIYA